MACYPNIQVTRGMAGWFAVMIDDSEGFPQPECSGVGRYALQKDAIREGEQWAEAEGLPFIMPSVLDEKPVRQDVVAQIKEIFPGIRVIELGDD